MGRLFKILALAALLVGGSAYGSPYFHHLGVSEGLAHPSVMSICQDSLGRLWFGTENGLSVFDGSSVWSCKPYEPRGGHVAFRGSVIKPMICDGVGNVHFLTEREWICSDARTDVMRCLMEAPFTALFLRDGNVCAVAGRECFRYDAATRTLESIGEMPFDGVRDYHVDKRGRHWLICASGLYRTDGDGDFVQISPIGDFYSIFESSEGEIWSGSNTMGLLRVRADGTPIRYTASMGDSRGFACDNVRGVAEDRQGGIWFGTFRGLYRYDVSLDEFVCHSGGDVGGALSQSSVHAVFVDADAVLWAGTYYGGVNYADTRRSAWSFWPGGNPPGALSSPIVGHLAEGRDGSVWICTEGGGLNRLDPRTGAVRHYDGLPFTHAKWLCEDADGNKVHVCTNRLGVFTVDVDSGEASQALRDDGDGCSPQSVVNVILQYEDKWILSTDAGVYVHSCVTGGDSLLYPKQDGIRYVHAAISGDELWLASSEVVAFDLRTMSRMGKWPIESNGVRVRPMRLLIADGHVLATTFGQGLFRLQDGGFVAVPGATLNTSGYQMVSAGDGLVAISGENGVQLLDMASGRPVHTFVTGSGLPLDAQVMDSGLLVTSGRVAYVGGTNGLVSFSLDDMDVGGDAPVYFSSVDIDGNPIRACDGTGILQESLPFVSGLKLKGRQSRIDIRLSSRRHAASFNWADYEYRVKGLDGRWLRVDRPLLSVSDLAPGRYELQLRRAASGDAPLARLGLRVCPPVYASWWAILSYSAVVAVLFWMTMRMLWIRRESSRVEELNETKLRFFTTISHELRSPLTLIIAQLDSIFRRFRLPPQLHHKLSRVMEQATQMNELVTELIDFRKYEQDAMRIMVSPVDVGMFAGDMAGKFSELAEGKGIELRLDKGVGSPVVYMDVYQMQKVMRNLILNAIKFTPGGGKVSLRVDAVDGGGARIHVIDTGIGVPEEDRERIFERFYQSGKAVETAAGGSGIGLALVRDIVRKHGGTVSVADAPGHGSDFVVSLPGGKEHFSGDPMVSVGEPVPAEDSGDMQVPDNGKYTIVIAEDDKEMAGLLHELFSLRYEVYAASDGREALGLVQSVLPDMVLSDVMMPGMGGIELCEAIKSSPLTSHIPVVLLTALSGLDRQLSGLRSGADDYVSKPFSSQLLLARCNNLVRAARRRAASPDAEEDLGRRVTSRVDKEFVDKVTAVLEEYLSDPGFGVDVFADKLHMSRSSFYGHFKSVIGKTPNEYVSQYRLRKACSILVERRDMPISVVAENLGFSSQQYFSRCFKEAYGVTPASWRRNGGAVPSGKP